MLGLSTRIFGGCLLLLVLLCAAVAQPDLVGSETVHPNLRVMVGSLPAFTAKDSDPSSVAKTAVILALSGSRLSCAPGSELEQVIEAHSGSSLATLAAKISGSTCVSNGQVHKLNAAYTPNGALHAGAVIASIMHGKPLILERQGNIYVLYGVIYDEHLYSSGGRDNVVREFLLIDPRYSDRRRFTSFVRGKDALADISGVASITAQ